jgi:hypothetical protein
MPTPTWDKDKAQLIAKGLFQMSGSNPSGNLQNPGRRYFLKLSTYAVREVDLVREDDGITYGR